MFPIYGAEDYTAREYPRNTVVNSIRSASLIAQTLLASQANKSVINKYMHARLLRGK
jgi:hypothetical protein